MSIGLGNVWRFPFTAYENGGGAFLIPYIIILTVVGRPFYLLEMILGQFSSKSTIKIWDMVPAFRGPTSYRYLIFFEGLLNAKIILIDGCDRYRIRAGDGPGGSGFVLLLLDGSDDVLPGGEFPSGTALVQVSPRVGSELSRFHEKQIHTDTQERQSEELGGALLLVSSHLRHKSIIAYKSMTYNNLQ